ncbi:MAG: acylphosphatase [Cyanobacteria bacterium QS_8_64_29]|nr:MAG: acylphosphatase [Cyanobacteria bacterium QS_8_64_29]
MAAATAQPQLTRARALISGKVQGVGYRLSALSQARQLGVSGWARNLPDGRVEAVLEGEEAAVRQMLDWCQHGPAAAEVRDVSIEYQQPEGLQGFETR